MGKLQKFAVVKVPIEIETSDPLIAWVLIAIRWVTLIKFIKTPIFIKGVRNFCKQGVIYRMYVPVVRIKRASAEESLLTGGNEHG